MLSNGDIAISGGPLRFEVLIYRHYPKQMSEEKRETVKIVDSLDCKGCQVMHLLELKGERFHFLMVVGHLAQFRFFKWVPTSRNGMRHRHFLNLSANGCSDGLSIQKMMNRNQFSQPISFSESSWEFVGVYSDEDENF